MAVLQGIGFGGARVGLETMVVDAAPARVRGRAVSLMYLGFDLGMVLSGLLMGVVADFAGYGQVYLIVGAVCFLTLVLFGAATRKSATA